MSETIFAEILSADPIGPLSLAQGRTAVQGDILANLLSFSGAGVRREYYVNDMGQRAAALSDSVRHCILADTEGIVEGRFDPTVRYVADRLLAEEGARLAQASDEEWRSLGASSVPRILLSLQRSTLNGLGVKFDTWFEERSLSPGAMEDAIERLRDAGRVEESGGALWMTAGQGDRALLRRENGAFSYFAVDIAYHLSKVARGATRMVDVWGPAYHRHRARLIDAVRAVGVAAGIEIVVVGPIRVRNDGVPVQYLDPAALLLDPLLEHGSAAGLRFRLNGAAPEEDLHLEVDALNAPGPPPELCAAWAALRALDAHDEAGPSGTAPQLRARIEAIAAEDAGPGATLVRTARFTLERFDEAVTRRRPDLVSAHLGALTAAFAESGIGGLDAASRLGIGAALRSALALLGLPEEEP